jgi:hypothetical protein
MLFDLPVANQVRVVGDGVAVGGSITNYLEGIKCSRIREQVGIF